LNKEIDYDNIKLDILFISFPQLIFVPTKLHWKPILWLSRKCLD